MLLGLADVVEGRGPKSDRQFTPDPSPAPTLVAERAGVDLYDAQEAGVRLIGKGLVYASGGAWHLTAAGAAEAKWLRRVAKDADAAQEALEL